MTCPSPESAVSSHDINYASIVFPGAQQEDGDLHGQHQSQAIDLIRRMRSAATSYMHHCWRVEGGGEVVQ